MVSERRFAMSEIEREARLREVAPAAVSEVLGGLFPARPAEGGNTRDANAFQDVALAWHAVNGDHERTHTVGTFVEPPRRSGALPVLVVYVDTKACQVDFMANREVYLARLAQVGLNFAEVRFRQSKRPRGSEPRKVVPTRRDERPARELPELTPEEEHDAQALLAHVPETLKDSVSRALRVSMRAEKRRNS